MTITLTVGPPGAGKTTWAKRQDAVRINRDDIRHALFGKWWGLTREQEEQVTDLQIAVAEDSIDKGRPVIVDDTNLSPRTQRMWQRLATRHCVPLRYKLFDVDARTCYERTEARWREEGERRIPRHVIASMRSRMDDFMKEQQ